ncbi:MAG: apolipoprotein N-acyltransferase [Acidobacteria bacterium]|nr:MAG: apolipoprotein N-acyltransferase [Acidobacteriota bacterium]
MQEAVSLDAAAHRGRRLKLLAARAWAAAPTLAEAACAGVSALLLLFAFPDFGVWPLAWVAFVPLLLVVARRPRAPQSFLLGLAAGALFFYTSCHWLTFPMIRYAEIPAPLANLLLVPAALAGGVFTALFALALSRLCARFGSGALFLAAPLWAALEWARLGVIGQLWNAVGYSQAFEPSLIQAARFGGVYAVGFLVLAFNAALAYALLKRDARATLVSLAAVACVALATIAAQPAATRAATGAAGALVVAVQPDIIPDFKRPVSDYAALAARHFETSASALRAIDEGRAVADVSAPDNVGASLSNNKVGDDGARAVVSTPQVVAPKLPRVVVWPESPMNFSFERDAEFREEVARFTRSHHTALLFNSLEPTAEGGGYNAAVLVNEEGRLAAHYDKIRLMPFGEYVPLPRWVPGADSLRGVVGDFTPGTGYTLMPLGGDDAPRAGVFICLESAYPHITRRFAEEGADVLIEITNDAYQGDTAVMRQHLSNAVFRAVETGRTLLRVTNTGISARITPRGEVLDETPRFQEAVRAWTVARSGGKTFYVRFGDVFVAACSFVSLFAVALSLRRRKTDMA